MPRIQGETWYRDTEPVHSFWIKRPYKYYDTPDGQDIAKKLLYINSVTIKFGLTHGLFESISPEDPPKNWQAFTVRTLSYCKPYLVIPSLACIGIYSATKWRGEDDAWNYVIGGIAGGAYYGKWMGNFYGGVGHSLILASILGAYKFLRDRNYNVAFDAGSVTQFRTQTMRTLKTTDFTYTEERPRTWYTAEEVKEKGLKLPQGKPGFIIA